MHSLSLLCINREDNHVFRTCCSTYNQWAYVCTKWAIKTGSAIEAVIGFCFLFQIQSKYLDGDWGRCTFHLFYLYIHTSALKARDKQKAGWFPTWPQVDKSLITKGEIVFGVIFHTWVEVGSLCQWVYDSDSFFSSSPTHSLFSPGKLKCASVLSLNSPWRNKHRTEFLQHDYSKGRQTSRVPI